jgi:methyl-accepting chemotaxis protein
LAAANATANTVGEITSSISRIGESAETARTLSSQAGELSRQGEAVVTRAAAEMERIETSVDSSADQIQRLSGYSDQISAIVGVIREIADQTNLLALNAAIEAARAGEQGRGFAVVADEVRKLAERTGKSTSEIAGMIASIQLGISDAVASMEQGRQSVRGGVAMVRDASSTMSSIQTGANEANAAVAKISSDLRDGSRNLGEISERMTNIVRLVDNNAGRIDAMSASAAELERLAGELTQSAAQFRL